MSTPKHKQKTKNSILTIHSIYTFIIYTHVNKNNSYTYLFKLRFSPPTLRRLYRGFKSECPSGEA